ncbi:hypothetical protein A2Z33_00165 [Candidatus Gottesmanbacteria bacterium RBG_16_52_11]|uniref:Magnesium transporter CorA n=1 Tax=Candidatus Gottesmanbacteria bacterium RBG_16_52_11 TaxID=1798374 RepID=A0A1F5YNG7_9BACT|nr:MAG: hypothetical protein A2Z33_00165 [Candidatus Gottesmanbacteria bacterium RBG_16_52_11]
MVKLYRKTGSAGPLIETDKMAERTWIYVEAPDAEEIEMLRDRWDLDAGHIQDALDPYEVPRFETEGEAAYIFTRVPEQLDDSFTTTPVLFILTRRFIVTVVSRRIELFDQFLSGTLVLSGTKPATVFLRLFGEVINRYSTYIVRINKRVVSLAAVSGDGIRNRDIIALVSYEYILNDWLNAIVQTNAFLRNLADPRSGIFVNKLEREKVEDLLLATGQLIALSKSSLLHAKNFRDASQTILTNTLNRVIKFFTTLTIVMTIPTIIASFYGMNVRLPRANSDTVFIEILLGTLGLMAGLLVLFLRKNWL